MKVLVVDDEALARDRLRRLLSRMAPDVRCLEAEGGVQALQAVGEENPDVVLLDIRMPGMDGIEVAAQLDDLPNPPAVIFCTAYDDHALEALQHQVVAYLLKPVREAELARALDNAGRVNRVQLASLRAGPESGARTHITSPSHRGVDSLSLDSIRCFIAEDKYVTAYSPDHSLVIPDSLKELEAELEATFLRVHRNALVSLQHVRRLSRSAEGWVVELEGVALSPQVSRRHLKAAKDRLKQR
ncbi:MAG: alginate biosynthesis regulator AlgR [Halioglobus sp.]